MKKSFIIAKKEVFDKIGSKNFLAMAFFGPLILLILIFLLFNLEEKEKTWNVLIVDPSEIMENKILSKEDIDVKYFFVNQYVELDEFKNGKQFKKFDAMLEVNEKVLSNKNAFLFYREKPTNNLIIRLHYQFERRIEELIMKQYAGMSIEKYRKLKQNILLNIRDVNDPYNEAKGIQAGVGLIFGILIMLFISIYCSGILRSVNREKSNRIIEVLLTSIKARDLFIGKIIGIGISSLIQIVLWLSFIAFGLFLLKNYWLNDIYNPENIVGDFSNNNSFWNSSNSIVYAINQVSFLMELIFERIQYKVMIIHFIIFFIFAYLFYASFFISLGAASNNESDGQNYIIPIFVIIFFSIYAGYFTLEHPNHYLSTIYSFLPFTSPVVCMVKLSIGYSDGNLYQLYLSLLILISSAILFLFFAEIIFKKSILNYDKKLKFSMFFKWIKGE